MTQPAFLEEIRDYVSRHFLVENDRDLNDESDLFEEGIIDSFGFIELVTFLEQTYGIGLSDDDLASAEISTVAGIARIVALRRAGSAP